MYDSVPKYRSLHDAGFAIHDLPVTVHILEQLLTPNLYSARQLDVVDLLYLVVGR